MNRLNVINITGDEALTFPGKYSVLPSNKCREAPNNLSVATF